jgi:hypothetical protein
MKKKKKFWSDIKFPVIDWEYANVILARHYFKSSK